ncbi:MAG TPA: hypothetical protein VNL14_23755 [Candidatus Acidoferrales bacterium]|nr:hypothetical protein [Candidatus Acidoferrales bacterium]
MIILSPEAKPRPAAEKVAEAQHVLDLSGKTLGILDNSKPNWDVMAARFEELLRERYRLAGVVRRRKISAQQGAPASDIAALAAEADFIINGLGD